jgi:hypothetical protein
MKRCGRNQMVSTWYCDLLAALDSRIDRLRHQKDAGKRLAAEAQLLAGILDFAQELEGRCLELRGTLGLDAKVE